MNRIIMLRVQCVWCNWYTTQYKINTVPCNQEAKIFDWNLVFVDTLAPIHALSQAHEQLTKLKTSI